MVVLFIASYELFVRCTETLTPPHASATLVLPFSFLLPSRSNSLPVWFGRSLSCSTGRRRNIRQCRGVLAKLSVALGRLRFMRSRLACRLPQPVCVFARVRSVDTCPRCGSVLTERPWTRSATLRRVKRRDRGRKGEETRETKPTRGNETSIRGEMRG